MVRRRRLAFGGAQRSLSALGVLVLTAGCAESTTPPASPSSLPAEKVQTLALACPAGVQVESRTGGPEHVTFDLPTAVGGLAPVAITCTPESGSSFPVGRQTVTCEATDQLGLTSSCTLRVTVFRPLALACPAGVQVESRTGGPERVTFDLPTPVGGLAPVATTCTPASGSSFPIGRHTVTCEATDQLGLTASCTLQVTVFRRIDVRRILAFGDSLTAGSGVAAAASYPSVLEALLRGRYVTQQITVTNEGLPGNPAAIALPRFEAALRRHDPDAVLIMQGTIDIDIERGAEAVEAVRNMVDHARDRGSDPIIATIPPQGRSRKAWEQVEPYNQHVRRIAAVTRVPLVDVYRIIRDGRCGDGPMGPREGSFSCLAADGLHLTAQGYALIAQGFFDELMALYERSGPGGQFTLTRGAR